MATAQIVSCIVFIYFFCFHLSLFVSIISGSRSWIGSSLLKRWRYLPVHKKTDGPALPSSTGNDPAFQRLRLKASKAALEELDQYISETWISSTVFAPPPKTGAFTVMPLGPIMMSKDGIMAWTVAHQDGAISPSTSWYRCWKEKLSCVPCKLG